LRTPKVVRVLLDAGAQTDVVLLDAGAQTDVVG
jgi:hypothetical protein